MLGGDKFLSQSDLDVAFSNNPQRSIWRKVNASIKLALRMTPRGERKNVGTFLRFSFDL